MSDTTLSKLAAEVDLPTGTAIWVLSAHLVTLLSPLAISWAAHRYADFLASVMAAPGLLHLTAGLMIAGSAFETAQNTSDRWFLSAATPSLVDCLFGTSVCLALATTVVACFGAQPWLLALVYGVALAYPLMYVTGWPAEAARGTLGVASVGALFLTFKDPVVFLSLVSVFLTLYFFKLLLKTEAQSLHGFTTLVNVLGVVVIPWAIHNAVRGEPMPWWQLLALAGLLVGAALAAYPWLSRLEPTRRPVKSSV